MVFGLMTSDGKVMGPIIFPAGQTVTSISYHEVVLVRVKETNYGPYSGDRNHPCVLMQDGAPAHTSKSTQQWLEANLGMEGFWGKEKWPPSSPDTNPLDFSFWAALARAVGAVPVPKSRMDLIRKLEQVWEQVLGQDYVIKTCQHAWEHLRRIVDVNGGYTELVTTISNVKNVDDNNV